jgi:hypothetical protein
MGSLARKFWEICGNVKVFQRKQNYNMELQSDQGKRPKGALLNL